MENDLGKQIETAAVRPQRTVVDGIDTTFQPLPDLIEADKHLAAKRAAKSGKFPLRIFKTRPPGIV